MMEFYAAYWNYQDLMAFTEELVRDAARKATGGLQLSYGGKPVDLAGDFVVPMAAVQDVHFDKVILKLKSLDARLRQAIGHAHDAEDA